MSAEVGFISGRMNTEGSGQGRFVNAVRPTQTDRFSCIYPAAPVEEKRGGGLRRNAKWFFVVRGDVKIGVVRRDNWGGTARSH